MKPKEKIAPKFADSLPRPKFFVLKYLVKSPDAFPRGYLNREETWATREEVDARLTDLKTYDTNTAFEVSERGHE